MFTAGQSAYVVTPEGQFSTRHDRKIKCLIDADVQSVPKNLFVFEMYTCIT